MARPASDLFTKQIEQLLSDREKFVSAIEKIDGILANIGNALGGGAASSAAPVTGKRRGRKPGRPAGSKAGRPKRGRGRFAQSGEEMVLAFVAGNKNASTKEINAAWSKEGRAGSADNALGKLVREKRLTRAKVKGGRGSTFTVSK